MNISIIEKINPSLNYYNLQNKLWEYVKSESQKYFDEAGHCREKIKTAADFESYVKDKRERFIKSIGEIPYDNSLPLNAEITGRTEEKNLVIENIIFQSRPSVYVTGNLYLPKKRKNPCGAVLFQVGHAAAGKLNPQYQRVARIIASAGLIVFVIDPVGQGERCSYFEKSINAEMVYATTPDHQYAGEQCVLIGDNIARYFIADAMRAVDYLSSRPEVDSEKIGATGSSGGGTATCHAMICDERIKAAAPATFVTTREAYLNSGTGQDSEQIWMGATKDGFDHHEAVMCFAPKPVLLLTADSDFFPVEGAEEVITVCKRFWTMYGKEENINIITDTSLHKYTDKLAAEAAKFFSLHLNGEKKSADMSQVTSIDMTKLLCTKSGQVRADYIDSKFVFDENLEKYKNLVKSSKNTSEFIREKMNFNRHEEPLHLRTFDDVYTSGLKITPYMWFPQKNLPNFALMFSEFEKETNEAVIFLTDSGTDGLRENIYKIRNFCKQEKKVFVLDLSGIGKCTNHALNTEFDENEEYGVIDRISKDLFFLGDSLCALRLYQLNYAIKMLKNKFNLSVSVFAKGTIAALARLYGYVDNCVKTETEYSIPSYEEIITTRYYENYGISGILLPGVAKYL